MRVIGLTGGIASGKSTVGKQLADLPEIAVLDADTVAHEVMAPAGPAYAEVVAYFGQGILNAEGHIDRPKLGTLVFNNPEALKALNERVHPHVRTAMQNWVADQRASGRIQTAFLMIPLLYESNLTHLSEEVWVVYCTPEQQLERLMHRNGLNETEAKARLAAQWPIDKKRELADWVIENTGNAKDLNAQIAQTIQRRLS